jgi:site-specific DNA recombinase
VSSDEQARNGVSMADQADRLEAYAKANDYQLLRVESDRGVSGYKAPDKRPAMKRALAAVKSGEADGIVAIALDRLSRNALEFMKLVDESDKQGWRLIAMDLNLDTGTPTGKLVANVLASVAQLYRDQISERTQSALGRVAREGRSRSRDLPFGWRTATGETKTAKGDKARIIKHSEEQRVLAKMLRMDKKGDGPQKIANALNESGSLTRNGKPWYRQLVHQTLVSYESRQEALDG